MGINPAGDNPIIVPPDNIQSRWGEWEADLDASGEVAGDVLAETWALADSANQGMVALSGTRGYVQAYQSRNINAEWGIGDNWRDIPFESQHGDALGGSVTPNGRLRLHSAGLWQIYARIHAGSSGYGGTPGLVMLVRVHRPNGTIIHTSRVETHSHFTSNLSGTLINTWETTVETTFPTVVTEANCEISVRAYVGQWRWWLGGTRFTHLAAVKQSGEPIRVGEETVPDEQR